MLSINIVHIITGLGVGGAEMMLSKLVTRMDRREFQSRVISLMGDGPVGDRIRAAGVPVHMLNINRDRPHPAAVVRLARLLRRWQPDIVQTWMYHSDLIGSVAARLAFRRGVIWNVRHGNLAPELNRTRTLKVAKICARMSRWAPKRIVCCSDETRAAHEAIGYDRSRLLTIPNGFDCDVFQPDAAARAHFRAERGIPEHAAVVGIAGRFDVHKDYLTFIRAAAAIRRQQPGAHFVLCGRDIDCANQTLVEWLQQEGLHENVHLLGLRADMPRVFAALDIAVSSSTGEGFPNVIGEAMATGVPCVTTDVGSSAILVGDTGVAVPASNPGELAQGCLRLIRAGSLRRGELGKQARLRVMSRFSLHSVIAQYEQLYKEVAQQCAA